MKQQKHTITLVKKRKAKHGVTHYGGTWKIAYADFMTAMMAFFLVMWLLAISSPQELTQIAEYFRTPLKAALTNGSKHSDSSSPIPGGGDDVTEQQGEVKKQIDVHQSTQEEEYQLNKLREKLDELIESDPRLKTLRPNLLINMMNEGLRIQIIDSQKRPMFKTGSTQVEPHMRDILRAIAPILNDIPNKISLSGHTDDLRYANGERGYSNWELSTDRANASRRELLAGGLVENKILRVVGMAASMRLHKKPADDPANRRISLLVLNKWAQQQIEHENLDNQALDIEKTDELKRLESGITQAVLPSILLPLQTLPLQTLSLQTLSLQTLSLQIWQSEIAKTGATKLTGRLLATPEVYDARSSSRHPLTTEVLV